MFEFVRLDVCDVWNDTSAFHIKIFYHLIGKKLFVHSSFGTLFEFTNGLEQAEWVNGGVRDICCNVNVYAPLKVKKLRKVQGSREYHVHYEGKGVSLISGFM